MNNRQHKLRLSISATFTLMALVIAFDFILPGRIITDEIIEVQRNRQQYYNAARNYHFSYKVITKAHQFSVAEDFAKSVQNQEKIEYSVSQIFKEVNWYRLIKSEKKATYSLRIISALILPLLTIIFVLLSYRYKRKIGTLVFVLQTLLTADLIYLLK